jgi:hypothetical protein
MSRKETPMANMTEPAVKSNSAEQVGLIDQDEVDQVLTALRLLK